MNRTILHSQVEFLITYHIMVSQMTAWEWITFSSLITGAFANGLRVSKTVLASVRFENKSWSH